MCSEHHQEVQYFTTDSMKDFPFSDAVRVGNMLYLSGQIGIDSSMKLVPGGIAAETQKVMENIKYTLERCGSSIDNVIKVTVMLDDISEWGEMNNVMLIFSPKINQREAHSGQTGLQWVQELKLTAQQYLNDTVGFLTE